MQVSGITPSQVSFGKKTNKPNTPSHNLLRGSNQDQLKNSKDEFHTTVDKIDQKVADIANSTGHSTNEIYELLNNGDLDSLIHHYQGHLAGVASGKSANTDTAVEKPDSYGISTYDYNRIKNKLPILIGYLKSKNILPPSFQSDNASLTDLNTILARLKDLKKTDNKANDAMERYANASANQTILKQAVVSDSTEKALIRDTSYGRTLASRQQNLEAAKLVYENTVSASPQSVQDVLAKDEEISAATKANDKAQLLGELKSLQKALSKDERKQLAQLRKDRKATSELTLDNNVYQVIAANERLNTINNNYLSKTPADLLSAATFDAADPIYKMMQQAISKGSISPFHYNQILSEKDKEAKKFREANNFTVIQAKQKSNLASGKTKDDGLSPAEVDISNQVEQLSQQKSALKRAGVVLLYQAADPSSPLGKFALSAKAAQAATQGAVSTAVALVQKQHQVVMDKVTAIASSTGVDVDKLLATIVAKTNKSNHSQSSTLSWAKGLKNKVLAPKNWFKKATPPPVANITIEQQNQKIVDALKAPTTANIKQIAKALTVINPNKIGKYSKKLVAKQAADAHWDVSQLKWYQLFGNKSANVKWYHSPNTARFVAGNRANNGKVAKVVDATAGFLNKVKSKLTKRTSPSTGTP